MAENTQVGMGLTFSAQDLASGPIGILSRNFNGLQMSMSDGMPRILGGLAAMGAGIASLSAGMGTLRTTFGLAQFAGGFDQEMAAVRTITQASAEDFRALSSAATEAGILTQFAPEEAAGGLRVLAQQGLITQDAIQGLVPVLDFAAAGNIAVGEAAEVAMGVMNAYGMEVENMTSVTDRLMRGTQLSALSANEFITVMGRAASSGNIFGTALDDVIIALGSMRSAGIPATVATTSLSEAMRRLATDEGAREVLQRFNVAAADSEGNLRSVIDISRDLQVAISGLTEVEQARVVNQAFGVRGMQEFAAIANIQARTMQNGEVVTLRGAEAIAHYRRELDAAGGTTEQFRRDRLATFQGQMTLLSGTVDTFRTVLGHAFGVVFRPLVLVVTEAINVLTRAWRGLSERAQTVIAIMVVVGAGLAVAFGFIMTVVGAVLTLVAVLGELLLVAGAVAAGIALAMIPVAIAIGGIIGLGYALYRAYQQNLGGLADFIDGWVSRISLAWTALTEIVSGDSFSAEVSRQLGLAENEGVRGFVMGIRDLIRRGQAVWQGFQTTFAEVWQNMAPVFEELKGAFSELFGVVGEVFGGLVEGGNAMPFDRFQSFGSMLAQTVGGALRAVVSGLTRLIRFGTWLINVFRALSASPIGTFLRGLATLAWRLGNFLATVLGYLFRIQRALSEGLLSGIIGVGRAIVGARARRTPAGEVREEANPVEELARDRRAREQVERTEASTTRPAAADAAGRDENVSAILSQLGETRRRGGGTTQLQNRVALQLDERELASVLQNIDVSNATESGGVITDEFGFQQSAG